MRFQLQSMILAGALGVVAGLLSGLGVLSGCATSFKAEMTFRDNARCTIIVQPRDPPPATAEDKPRR